MRKQKRIKDKYIKSIRAALKKRTLCCATYKTHHYLFASRRSEIVEINDDGARIINAILGGNNLQEFRGQITFLRRVWRLTK